MARKLRIQYPGAIYHVMNRGDRREAVFKDERDRECFLEILGEACRKTGWQAHAYCLMPNHFHLVLETPEANLVAGMKWLLGTYTGRYNRRHKEFGHLFSGRYKALMVDGSGTGYLKTVCDYVHLNPARAKLLGTRESLEAFPWSSYRAYLSTPGRRPVWLRVDRLLGEWRIARDTAAGRRTFAGAMEERRGEDDHGEFKPVERGWFLGSEEFRQELLEQVKEAPGGSHYGEAVHEAVEARAERWVRTELAKIGWTEEQLQMRRKGDPVKVKLASELRSRTALPLAWIARRLSMGTRGHLTWLLQRSRMPPRRKDTAQPLLTI